MWRQDAKSKSSMRSCTHARTAPEVVVPGYEYPALSGSKGSNDKGKSEFYCGQWFKHVHTLRTPAVYLPATVCMCVRILYKHSQVDQECRIFNNLSTQRQQVHSKRRMLGSYVSCLFCDDVPRRVVSKVCSLDPKGSASSSQGIRGYTSVMATFKFTYVV
jgi:hypothetical protein